MVSSGCVQNEFWCDRNSHTNSTSRLFLAEFASIYRVFVIVTLLAQSLHSVYAAGRNERPRYLCRSDDYE